jgi:protein-L-isoaspartate(D-aspartate) O-methyltransferase
MPSADQLREALVRQIRAAGGAQREPVHRALRAVPRHVFLPEVSLEEAYAAGTPVVTKRDPDGRPLSSASAPGIVAAMLDQLDVHPGQRVLEIGAGTGYNAALLAELAGPGGRVTSIDVDPWCTARARRALERTGHAVDLRTGDGAHGTGDGATFDRIIVTAGAWDIPPAWFDQLAVGGRLVLPLRWRGQSQSVAFVREVDRLRSDGLCPAGFIPMTTLDGEERATIGETITLVRDADQAVDVDGLWEVLDGPPSAAWTGVTADASFRTYGLWLRLTIDPRTCWLLSRHSHTAPDGSTAAPVRGPALVDGASLALLAFRGIDEEHSELGALGFGPSGAALAADLASHVRAWDAARDAQPQLVVHPVGAALPDGPVPNGTVIEKRHTRLVVTYPDEHPPPKR